MSDQTEQPFADDDSLVSPELIGSQGDTSDYTRDVPMSADGSGRVVTAADRGEDQTFDPTAQPTPDGDPADIAVDGGEDSAAAGRAE